MQELSFIWKYKILATCFILVVSITSFYLGNRVQEKTDFTSIEEFFWFVFIAGILSSLFYLFQSKFSESLREYIKGEVNKTLVDYRSNIFNCIDDIKSTIGYVDDEDKNDLGSGLEKLKETLMVTEFDLEVMSCLALFLSEDKQAIDIIDEIAKTNIKKHCQEQRVIQAFINDIMKCMTWLTISFEEKVPRVIQRDSFESMTTAFRQGLPHGLDLYEVTLFEILETQPIQTIIEKKKSNKLFPWRKSTIKKSNVMEIHINFLMYEIKLLSSLI